MKAKTPAFQFYPTDYLSSQRVQMMTLAEEGAYIRLLCYCWDKGSIPADHGELTRLIGKGAKPTMLPTVVSMFIPCPDDPTRLIHERLETERAKQKYWKEKSKDGGKASGELRKIKANGSQNEQPPLNHPSITVARVEEPKGKSRGAQSSTSVETSVVPSGENARIPCSPEEVIKHDKTILPPDEGFASWWWNTNNAVGWVTNSGVPIRNWKSAYQAAKSSNIHNKQEREFRFGLSASRAPAARAPMSQEPPGGKALWEEFLTQAGIPIGPFQFAQDYQKDDFRAWKKKQPVTPA